MPKSSSKRSFRGRRSRRPQMSFQSRVLQAVRSKREIKTASVEVSRTMNNAISQQDLYGIVPNIQQGVKEYERVGNKINLLKVVVRGYFQLVTNTATPNLADSSCLVRHQIIKQKSANWNQVGPGQGFSSNVLLEGGNPYTGTIMNHMTPLNTNAFTSKKTIRTKLVGQNPYYTGAGASPDAESINTMLKPFSYTLRFGKQGKTLDYQTTGALDPTNWDYFMINSVQNTFDGSAPPVAQIQFRVDWYYTDA